MISKPIVTLLFLLLVSSFPVALAQKELPVVRSNSKLVDIKLDGQLLNVQWYCQPEVRPDVFKIERYLDEKRVSFHTGIDSISFNVKPGGAHDFIILLNNSDSCFTRITTLHAPPLTKNTFLVPFTVGLAIAYLILYWKRKSIPTKSLLFTGMIIPVLFWSSTIVGGFIHGNYNHLTMVVSDLGALGKSSELFMLITTLLLSILCPLFFAGLLRICRLYKVSVIPAIAVLSIFISFGWAAIFPMGHELHGKLGPLFLLTYIGTILAMILWKGKQFRQVRNVSSISFIFFTLGFLRFLPEINHQFPGLIQRFFHLGWSVWFFGLGYFLVNKSKVDSH